MINSYLVLFNNRRCMPQSSISKIWWRGDTCRVRLAGHFPNCLELNQIQNGDTIEVLYRTGTRCDFSENDIVIRLTNCIIQKKWMVNLSPLSPEYLEDTKLYVSLTCHIEIVDGAWAGEYEG